MDPLKSVLNIHRPSLQNSFWTWSEFYGTVNGLRSLESY